MTTPNVQLTNAQPAVIREIEEAVVAHWSYYGRWPKGRVVEDDGLVWFETPIDELPFNGVIRSHIGGDADARITDLCRSFRTRGVPFFWVVHPTAEPADLGDRLLAHGLQPVEPLAGMSLELDGWSPPATGPPTGVTYAEVVDEASMRMYEELVVRYWQLPDSTRTVVAELTEEWAPGRAPGERWLAYTDGTAVGKAYLSLAGPEGVAAIYGMSVQPEARGRGVASGMTTMLLRQAKAAGRKRVVLHASEMAVGLYRRVGFVERCRLTIYATAPIWSDDGGSTPEV